MKGRDGSREKLKLVGPYLAAHRKNYSLYTLMLFLSSLFSLFVPWYMKNAIDSLKTSGGRPLFARSLLLMAVFALLHSYFRFLGRRGFLLQARRIESEIREDLFDGMLYSPMETYDRFSTGDLMSRSVNDLTSIWLLLGPGLLTLTATVITYVIAFLFMVRIDPLLTGVIFSIVPLVVLLGRFYSRRLYNLYRASQEVLSRISDRLNNYIQGIRVIKAYSMENFTKEEFSRVAGEYSRKNIKVAKVSSLFHGTVALASGLGVLLILLIGGNSVVKGTLSMGGFVAFTAYLAMLSFPTIAMGWVINLFQRGASAASRICEVMEGEGEGTCKGDYEEINKIEFLRVSFKYRTRDTAVLNNFNLCIKKGEALGVTGLTGAGKSSLVKLILGFYEPDEGEILINGVPLNQYGSERIRKKVGVALQDSHLFSDTVLNNISFPLDGPDLALAQRWARTSHIEGDIEGFPGKYDAIVGERGVTLSGGQRQRVSLSRTLCHGAKVLILDDTFSSVDVETEKKILENILNQKEELTLLVISHRISALSICDRIAVLEGGTIVEEGSEEELLALKGQYFRFHMKQLLTGEDP